MFCRNSKENVMSMSRSPRDIARRLGKKSRAGSDKGDGWRRETFTLPRTDARAKAREWFDRYPKAAYMTEIEFWRELDDGRIEFVMRRLPSAD
jgi:hypothetical protein